MRGPYGDGSRRANPLASLLPGTWCACLIQVQGQQQRVPECTYRAHQSQTPTMSRSWGPGLLQPKVLCNPWCCCQSLHRRCWGTAGSPTPQAEPLPPPVPPDTGAADTPLRRGHTDVSRWGTRLFQRKSLRTLLPDTGRRLEHCNPTESILQQEKPESYTGRRLSLLYVLPHWQGMCGKLRGDTARRGGSNRPKRYSRTSTQYLKWGEAFGMMCFVFPTHHCM